MVKQINSCIHPFNSEENDFLIWERTKNLMQPLWLGDPFNLEGNDLKGERAWCNLFEMTLKMMI
jgi:hypothetical protein